MSVVICAYSDERWDALVEAVDSVRAQTVAAREIIVAIDHNESLRFRADEALAGVVVVTNDGARGAGPTRNAGVTRASGTVLAFLDDDAVAAPDWIERAVARLVRDDVLGVGGTIVPLWETRIPGWFPSEFGWVVGCTYTGVPKVAAPVRNLIAASMFVRRAEFDELRGFRSGFGKVGAASEPEETDLCIRANRRWPERHWLFDPDVRAAHRVSAGRATTRYFVRRCFYEGRGKAALVAHVGRRDGLAEEQTYTTYTLPRGVVEGLKSFVFERDRAGLARSAAILLGLTSAGAGYVFARLRTLLSSQRH